MATPGVKNISRGPVEITALRQFPLQTRETIAIPGQVPDSIKWLVGQRLLALVTIPDAPELPKSKDLAPSVQAPAKKPKE